MSANTPEQLHHRATLLAQCARNVTTAKFTLNLAVINARSARADLGVMQDMDTAIDTLTRICKRAELQRQRLLRKADRKGESS